jgi:hypothetical protein
VEIGSGEDIVAKINEGLDEAGCGIIVFSKESWESPWARAEASYLQYAHIEEGTVLMPVIIGQGWLPPLLRPLARLSSTKWTRSPMPPPGAAAGRPGSSGSARDEQNGARDADKAGRGRGAGGSPPRRRPPW